MNNRTEKFFKTVAETLSIDITLDIASVTSVVNSNLTIDDIANTDTNLTFTVADGSNNQEYSIVVTYVDSEAVTQTIYVILAVTNDATIDYYGTVADADDYFDLYFQNNLQVYWNLMFPSVKFKALVQATRIIDTLSFSGDKTNDTQTLEFPRDDLPIPTNIERATYEEALAIAQGISANDLNDSRGIKIEQIDTAKVEYDKSNIIESEQFGIISQSAWRLLLPYLASNRSLQLIRIN